MNTSFRFRSSTSCRVRSRHLAAYLRTGCRVRSLRCLMVVTKAPDLVLPLSDDLIFQEIFQDDDTFFNIFHTFSHKWESSRMCRCNCRSLFCSVGSNSCFSLQWCCSVMHAVRGSTPWQSSCSSTVDELAPGKIWWWWHMVTDNAMGYGQLVTGK